MCAKICEFRFQVDVTNLQFSFENRECLLHTQRIEIKNLIARIINLANDGPPDRIRRRTGPTFHCERCMTERNPVTRPNHAFHQECEASYILDDDAYDFIAWHIQQLLQVELHTCSIREKADSILSVHPLVGDSERQRNHRVRSEIKLKLTCKVCL